MEPERVRNVEFLGCNDPHMYHNLPYDPKYKDLLKGLDLK